MSRGHRRTAPLGRRSVAGLRFVGVALLVALPVGAFALSTPSAASAPAHAAGAKLLKLLDGGVLTLTTGNGSVNLVDAVGFGTDTGTGSRSYTVRVSATAPAPNASVLLETAPTVDWAGAGQLPDGPDNLPPVTDWSWSVTNGHGRDDSANWSVNSAQGLLVRSIGWSNQSYTVTGTAAPVVRVAVDPAASDGSRATGGGYVVNAGGYPNFVPVAPGYLAMARALAPSVVRISVTQTASITGWDATTHQPTLSFQGFDRLFAFANATGGSVFLSLPAGTWGDGNDAPSGTPVYGNVSVGLHGSYGNFVTEAALYAIVRNVANHTRSAGERIAYWGVGNEVPLNSTAQTWLFDRVLDGAAQGVQDSGVGGLVGPDTGLSSTYLPEVAAGAPHLGFLSFHYYPATGLCIAPNGSYCAPQGGTSGTLTSAVLSTPSYGRSSKVLGPRAAQAAWFNATGDELPVLNVETNFNSYGGGPLSYVDGTDPRGSDLVGAAWLGSLLADSSAQNVSALTFFTLTSSANLTASASWGWGGFGFGLTNVTGPGGAITRFAPFYVLQLWDRYFPRGTPGIRTNSSDPAVVDAYAVSNGSSVVVALASRVPENVSVHLALAGNWTLNTTETLDRSSYREVRHTSNGTTVVESHGPAVRTMPAGTSLPIDGYGFAVAEFVPTPTNGSSAGGNGSGNGTGSGSGNGTGGGTGNASGNATGNGTSAGNGSAGTGGSSGTGGAGGGAGNGSPGSGSNGSGGNGSAPPRASAPPTSGVGPTGGTRVEARPAPLPSPWAAAVVAAALGVVLSALVWVRWQARRRPRRRRGY